MLKFINLCHAPLTNWELKLVDIQDGWTMLDIGCGGGATLQRLLKRSQDAKVYGIDISEESVAKAKKVNADVLDKQVFVTLGSAEKLPYEDGKFDLVTAVETVYFWPNLPNCLKEVRRVLKPGGKFAIMVEVIDGDSMWTNVVEGMTAYSPEELKMLLDDTGFIQTEIHRMKPSNATIIGVKAVEEVPGVEKAKASASANTLTIKGPATEEAIRAAVEGIGYTFKGRNSESR